MKMNARSMGSEYIKCKNKQKVSKNKKVFVDLSKNFTN